MELVRFLITNGADPGARACAGLDCWPETYLERAARLGHVEFVRLFADAGNPVDRPPERLRRSDGYLGRSPLMIATTYGRTDVVRVLIEEFGVKIATRNGHGCSAIDFAIVHEHDEIADYLRNAGATPDRSLCRFYQMDGR